MYLVPTKLSQAEINLGGNARRLTASELIMGRFPEDFAALLIVVAIVEGAAGVFKSSFKYKRLFWTGLFVEMLCALVQSMALFRTLEGASYTRLEIAAAYLTIIVDALILLSEAFLSFRALEFNASPGTDLIIGMIIGIPMTMAALPFLLAKMLRRALKRFKRSLHSWLLLTLPLLSGVLSISFFIFTWRKEDRWNDCLLGVFCVCFFAILMTSLGLGAGIVNNDDNLSLSFHVITNLSPAVFTFVVHGFHFLFMKREKAEEETPVVPGWE